MQEVMVTGLQLDRGALMAAYEESDDEHRAWIESHYSDLRQRPVWGTRGESGLNKRPSPLRDDPVDPVGYEPWPRMERVDCGRRKPRLPTLCEVEAWTAYVRRVL